MGKKNENEKFGTLAVGVRDYHFILFLFYFFRKNLNLYLIPRAKYILQQN